MAPVVQTRHRVSGAAPLALALATLSGCYTTRSGAYNLMAGQEHTTRQWFTAAGLVPLSDTAGTECTSGLAWSEATTSGSDFLIAVGTVLLGGIIGGTVCGQMAGNGPMEACSVVSVFGPPLLIGSRTVSYACAQPQGAPPSSAGEGAPAWPPAGEAGPPRVVPPPVEVSVPPPPPLPPLQPR